MDLSPIDLIKNEMLARADSDRNLNIDNTYEKWMRVIAAVGPDGGAQERFLRYYYNAFKSTVGTPATHSNLIRLYENWLDEKGVDVLLDELAESGRVYGMLAGSTDDCGLPAFKKISDSLRHAGGAQGFMPLMWFTANRERQGSCPYHNDVGNMVRAPQFHRLPGNQHRPTIVRRHSPQSRGRRTPNR